MKKSRPAFGGKRFRISQDELDKAVDDYLKSGGKRSDMFENRYPTSFWSGYSVRLAFTGFQEWLKRRSSIVAVSTGPFLYEFSGLYEYMKRQTGRVFVSRRRGRVVRPPA